MSTDLEGKRILITGGASGLGAAIARAVCAAGGLAIVGDVREAQAQGCVQEIGGKAVAIRLDVGDQQSIGEALAGIVERHGGLDAVVNNAGVDVTLPIGELSVEAWQQVLRVNLHGPFLVTKLALPELRKTRGQVVNIASTAAKRAWPNASAYHASKWGLLGLSHALHAELRSEGIKVTAVIAGGMRTPFLLDRFPDIDPATLQDPADVARAVVFALSSPADSVVAEITVLPLRESSWP